MAKKKKPEKIELQALKVAVSKTLRTRVVKSRKEYTRKMKHQKAHFPFFLFKSSETWHFVNHNH
jgi:hypothetical protein